VLGRDCALQAGGDAWVADGDVERRRHSGAVSMERGRGEAGRRRATVHVLLRVVAQHEKEGWDVDGRLPVLYGQGSRDRVGVS
jgi:hypothetical protein